MRRHARRTWELERAERRRLAMKAILGGALIAAVAWTFMLLLLTVAP